MLRDSLIYSRWYLQHFERPHTSATTETKISVAIPHYERSDLIHVALKHIWRDDRIAEIVVLDDGSSAASFEKLNRVLQRFGNKIRLFRREDNRGTLATKVEVVSLCEYPWVILLDSDNTVFPSYLDALFEIPSWDPDAIYCPDSPYPHFDFRHLAGKTLDFKEVHSLALTHSLPAAFINDGNYFLNRDAFLEIVSPYRDYRVHAADVLFANYLWLSAGKRLHVLCDASYYHRIHAKSIWLQTEDLSMQVFKEIMDGFRSLTRAEEADLSYLEKMPSTSCATAIPLHS